MQILKQQNKTSNYVYSYSFFLKYFNFNKKLKQQNNFFFKNTALVANEDSYFMEWNKKENFCFPNLNNNEFFKRKFFINTVTEQFDQNLILNNEDSNYFLTRLYIYLVLKKRNLPIIRQYDIDINNEIKNSFYIKKNNPFYLYIQGRILKTYKKKYILVSLYGLILKMHKSELFHKRKIIYSRYRFYRLFSLYKGRSKLFKLSRFQVQKTKQQMNFSRKKYVQEFKKKQK